ALDGDSVAALEGDHEAWDLVAVPVGDTSRLGERLPVASLRPAPAVVPAKTVCIGLNYRDHLEEQHLPMPDRPTIFGKWPNAVVASGESVVRPEGCNALDAEVELGVVIGRRARRVDRADAMDHVAGYVVVNDVTARDWQGNKGALHPGARGDGQWLRAKGSDTFLPIGPIFVSKSEVADPGNLRLRSWWTRGAGPDAGRAVLMQDGTSADMLFDIPAAIEFVSRVITLEPGDLLATGTPSGVGVFRDPPVFLEPGDRVRCEVEGIGSVENPIVDWSDDRPS
ncbi:MAG TPA: fumarylacetoacetate hydrolase family protein, partial [Candidatus Limnocylindrales bacterium]|nr:fumarylacetoacetate hydrolase family protein [Candidatus Limnocylindrales bacterium]